MENSNASSSQLSWFSFADLCPGGNEDGAVFVRFPSDKVLANNEAEAWEFWCNKFNEDISVRPYFKVCKWTYSGTKLVAGSFKR
jgi:hypothetical protein